MIKKIFIQICSLSLYLNMSKERERERVQRLFNREAYLNGLLGRLIGSFEVARRTLEHSNYSLSLQLSLFEFKFPILLIALQPRNFLLLVYQFVIDKLPLFNFHFVHTLLQTVQFVYISFFSNERSYEADSVCQTQFVGKIVSKKHPRQ